MTAARAYCKTEQPWLMNETIVAYSGFIVVLLPHKMLCNEQVKIMVLCLFSLIYIE